MSQSLDGADLLLEIAREVVVELVLKESECGIEGAGAGRPVRRSVRSTAGMRRRGTAGAARRG